MLQRLKLEKKFRKKPTKLSCWGNYYIKQRKIYTCLLLTIMSRHTETIKDSEK